VGIVQTLKSQISRREAKKDIVFSLYNQLVAAARQPALYNRFKVPDTLDGRFDCIVLHMSLFIAATDEKAMAEDDLKALSRDLVSVFLKDMDRNLREIGIGDLSVGKQVKKMGTAFLGRVDAYKKALASKTPEAALAKALERNLYRGDKRKPVVLKGLAAYAKSAHENLAKLTISDIRTGQLPKETFRIPGS